MADQTPVRSAGTITVGLVASHREWRTDFARYVQDHITGLRVRVLRDPRAIDGSLDAIIIDDSSTFLNRESLRRLSGAGVEIIGVYDPAERQGQGQAHLNRLGIADVASAEVSAAQLVELIRDVVQEPGQFEVDADADADAEADIDVDGFHGPMAPDLEASIAIEAARSAAAARVAPRPGEEREWFSPPESFPSPSRTEHGVLITVGGPSALAAVEVAVGLAADLAERRGTSLIIDTDETTPLLSARLGYRLEPSVLDAMERIQDGDGDLSQAVTKPTQGSRGFTPMHVMVGIANPDDWSLLGRERCADVLSRASEQWEHVVALSGPRIISTPQGTDRYGASRGAVATADAVVGVFDPTPTGILHGLDWLIEARRLRQDAPVWIAFAGRPRSAFQRADLVEAITRQAGVDFISGILFVPMGPEVEKASWDGRVVVKGRFVKAIRALTEELVPAMDEVV